MRNELDALLSKRMTRKEFLQHIGSVLLVVVGAGALLSAFKPQHKSYGSGYGSSSYGGTRKI